MDIVPWVTPLLILAQIAAHFLVYRLQKTQTDALNGQVKSLREQLDDQKKVVDTAAALFSVVPQLKVSYDELMVNKLASRDLENSSLIKKMETELESFREKTETAADDLEKHHNEEDVRTTLKDLWSAVKSIQENSLQSERAKFETGVMRTPSPADIEKIRDTIQMNLRPIFTITQYNKEDVHDCRERWLGRSRATSFTRAAAINHVAGNFPALVYYYGYEAVCLGVDSAFETFLSTGTKADSAS